MNLNNLHYSYKQSNQVNSLFIKIKHFFINNSLFLYTTAAIFVKSLFFIGLSYGNASTKIDMAKAHYWIPSYLVYLAFIITFTSVSYLIKNRTKLWYLIGINFIVSLIIVFDLMNYRAFGSFVTLHLLNQTSNLENLGDSIRSMMRWVDLLFMLDIILITVLAAMKKSFYRSSQSKKSLFIALFLFSTLFIYAFHYKVDVIEKGQKQILFRICWTPTQTMSNLSPIGYHIYDGYNYFMDSKPYKPSKEEELNIKNWFISNQEDLPDNEYKGMFEDKNLLFLQVESLETFVINKKINNQEITPNINKLLGNSLYFSNFHEQVNNGTSSDGDLLANTSVYPVRRGSTFFRYPGNVYNSLPKLLEERNYSTVAIHPDKGSYWNWMPALQSIGFKKTIDESSFVLDEKIGLGLSDGSYFNQVIPFIKKLKQPFYTFMVTLSSHAPFDIEEKYWELNLPAHIENTKLGGYFQSINYTDKQIGNFINKLNSEGLLEDTVIFIYGDHTGIHKFYQEELDKITPSEDWWLQNSKEVPLIIYNNSIAGKEIETIGGQIDLLPTAAYLMGVDDDKYSLTAMGRNLLKTDKSFTVLSSGEYIGSSPDEKEKEDAQRGLDVADIIIRSNYFKESDKK